MTIVFPNLRLSLRRKSTFIFLFCIVALTSLGQQAAVQHEKAAIKASPAAPTGTSITRNDDNTRSTPDQLASKAVIRRDRFGVPHILAESEEAAAFAQGYATAEDHGAELARLFLRAKGALASVFGEQFAEQDMRTLMLGIYDIAASRFDELPPYMQRILDGYAEGYDYYLAHHRAEFPEWAARVTGVDVLAHCRAVLLLDFALNLGPLEQAARANSSTMWAVGRPLSKSGHAMLLANPHVIWDGGTIFHEVQITVPGVINVSGATFIGMPVVTIGFNDVLGWSHTVNQVNSDNLYELTLDDSGTHYFYDGDWFPLKQRTISITVHTDSGPQTLTRTALFSHYGPVFQTEDKKTYAFKSANLSDVNFLTQYNLMGKATSLHAFLNALNMQQLPMFNVAYADRQGNIWYAFNGRIPIRPNGYNWAGVVPGNTSKTEWFAIHPLGDLPQLLNPKTGYVQNCNDAPWYTNLEQPIDPAPYADYLEKMDGAMGWRTQASLRFLSSEHALTLEKLMAYKFDSEILIATRVKGELLSAVKEQGKEEFREAVNVLETWDNHADANSRGAVLFFTWWAEYYKLTSGKPFKTEWSRSDPLNTPAGLSDPARALQAFETATASVKQRYGTLDVVWGNTHRLRHGTLDLPLNGTPLTLDNVMYRIGAENKLIAIGGDSFVLAVEFTEEGPRAYSIMPESESANPKSAHFNDQGSLYANKQYKPAWHAEKDITANLSTQYHPDH